MNQVTRRLLPGLLLVLALVLAGCGGGDPKKEKSKFLASANAICNQYEVLQNAVRFPSVNPLSASVSFSDRARWGLSLKQVVDYGRQEVKSLRKLDAPKDLRDPFQEMVETKAAAFEELAKGADAAKRNHRTLIEAPVNAGRAKLGRVSTLAKQLGTPRCA